jgi:hypothetical protein
MLIIATKVCTHCGKEKDEEEFYKCKRFSNRTKEYYWYINSYCKECQLNQLHERNKMYPQKCKEQLHKYYISEKGRKLYRENDARMRADGTRKKWEDKNKDKIRQYNEDRKHKNHKITKEELKQMYKYFDSSCAYCGISEEEHLKRFKQKLHKEHVDHNGTNGIENCVPACKFCNSSKNTRVFEEWYREKEYFSQERYEKVIDWLNIWK